MPLRVIFVRHGESQANIDQCFANRPGDDGELTLKGVAQANTLGNRLAPFGVTHIYASPLARARQTAEVLGGFFDVPVRITDALREYDVGEFEGLPYGGEHSWRMDRYWQIEREWRSGNGDACHPGGERLTDLVGRFVPFMEELPRRHAACDVVALVSHGGLYRLVLPALFPAITYDFALAHPHDYGGMIIGVHDRGSWRCERWLDTTFNSKA